MNKQKRLGVNIDHVATLREARGTCYPEPLEAAKCALAAGADGITIHLREDRRHIQDDDVSVIRDSLDCHLNLEMAVCDEMVGIALANKPEFCCFVPEKRQELTTEGGLDVCSGFVSIEKACKLLQAEDISVSLFIDPVKEQIDAALQMGAHAIELHTGNYADTKDEAEARIELKKIEEMAVYASDKGLIVNAGHGLHYQNVQPISAVPSINELNIGHSIIARAVFVGLEAAVREMKNLM